ncbi:hypothetical protein CYMTET_5894 [Cymbomonas tetramitiformis]|uniref:Uncharacterized protein n=1 Tax=Cymbomonas tetramitiformis TaxID=36881 RepID=A0AAE0GYB9_9CHLO|nr:hypothetical protein CYMTET_5894 [Cymbomonas tetramitiformis]
MQYRMLMLSGGTPSLQSAREEKYSIASRCGGTLPAKRHFSNACNSLDVFMVSIIAALMELGLFAKFLLDGSCDELNRILKQYFRYNFSSESDAVCYQVSASLLAGAYILMVCVLFYITITQLCLYIFNTALKQRYKALRDGSSVRKVERVQEGSQEHASSSLRTQSRCIGWMQYCGLVEDVPVVVSNTAAGDSEWVAYLPQDPTV